MIKQGYRPLLLMRVKNALAQRLGINTYVATPASVRNRQPGQNFTYTVYGTQTSALVQLKFNAPVAGDISLGWTATYDDVPAAILLQTLAQPDLIILEMGATPGLGVSIKIAYDDAVGDLKVLTPGGQLDLPLLTQEQEFTTES